MFKSCSYYKHIKEKKNRQTKCIIHVSFSSYASSMSVQKTLHISALLEKYLSGDGNVYSANNYEYDSTVLPSL